MAAFVSMIVGTVLSKYIWTHLPPLAKAAAVVGEMVVAVTGVQLSDQLTGSFIIIVGLSFIWGVVYHWARH